MQLAYISYASESVVVLWKTAAPRRSGSVRGGRQTPPWRSPVADRASSSLGAYDRMNPSISDSAKSIAALIDLPDCVH